MTPHFLTHSAIKAVAFDAVGTVLYPTPSVADAYGDAIARHFHQQVDVDRIRQTTQAALQQRSATADLSTNEAAEKDFWRRLVDDLCPLDDSQKAADCFDDLFRHFAAPGHWSCFPEVQSVLPQLQSMGLTVAIASNFDRRLHSVCDGLPPLDEVPQRIISSVVGYRKPAPEFFDAVCAELQLLPRNILFVGDDLINDVYGALQAGMQAAWVQRQPSSDAAPEACHVLSTLTDLLPSAAGVESSP